MSPRKLQFKKAKTILLMFTLGLLLEGPSLSFAQEDSSQSQQEAVQADEGHDTKDLEQLLKRYNKDAEKVIDDTSKIQETDSSMSEVTDQDLEEAKTNVDLNAAAKTLADKKSKRIQEGTTGKSLSEDIRLPLARLQAMSEEELLKLLKENTKDSKFAPYIEKFPKISILSVKLIKDKDAIPSAVKIIEDRDKLVWFVGIMISTILIGFLLERIMKRKDSSVLGAIGLFFLRVLILTIIRIVIIIVFYGKELGPATKVVNNMFFS